MNVVDDETMLTDIKHILKIIKKQIAKIYMHCMGGHGRTGTVAAILLGKLYSLTATQSLQLTSIFYSMRFVKDKTLNKHNIDKSPNRKIQIVQVIRILQ